MLSTALSQRDLTMRPMYFVLDNVRSSDRWGFPEMFVISQTILPAILFLPGTQPLRLPIRVAAFAISLAALGWWWHSRPNRRVSAHVSEHWLMLALAYLVLMIVHPNTNTSSAGAAQVMLYLSVLAPVFWAPSLVQHPQQLSRLLAIMLVCNGANALVGVLQVYDPATWMPRQLSDVLVHSKYGLSTVSYINSVGQRVVRPPGVSDNPGAVCVPGMIAAMLGLSFFISPNRLWKRLAALAIAVIGVAAIYLSQVRTPLLILCVMIFIYAAVVFVQNRMTKALVFLSIAGVALVVIFGFSSNLAGDEVDKRFLMLREGNPINAYYGAQRGGQLERAFTSLLPEYPLGAGLGRWGMMRYYFGDESNSHSPLIWAELQIPAWILDGGVPLLILYGLALIATSIYEFRVARMASGMKSASLVATVVAMNAGILALVFGFTPFTTPLGLQYWFLVGALHGVAQTHILPTRESLCSSQR